MKIRLMIAAVAAVGMLGIASLGAAEKEAKKDKLAGIKCPVSGKAVKEASAVDYKGAHVYFCCDNCPKAFAANTAKFATKANMQLVATKQAKEVKCPLTGKKLNPETKIDVSGVAVCFCCPNCKAKVSKATGDDQIVLIFSDAAFAKGFEVAKPGKK